jgi:signal transduction histidine kinase
VLLAAAGGSIWMASVAFARKQLPGGRKFGWLNLAVALWSLVSAAHAFPQTIEAQMVWTRIQYVAIFAVPPLWLLFAAEYLRLGWARRRRARRAVWILPLAGFLAVVTNGAHHLYFTGVDRIAGVTVYRWGPLFWIAAAHNYILMAAGAFLLLRGLRGFPSAFRSQMAVLVTAAAVPWIGNAAYISGLLRPGFDPTPVLFAVSTALFFWGLYAYKLFDVIPTARAAVFEGLSDAVFVLDRGHRIIDANTAAVSAVDAHGFSGAMALIDDVIGKHPAELLSWWKTLPAPPAPSDAEPQIAAAGDRLLEVRASTLVDARGGTLLWIRDVTARRRAELDQIRLASRLREQERIESLTVMAAGLAHDFNNLLTAVLGNADYLVATSPADSERRASAEAITAAAQHAADLVSQIVAFSGQKRALPSPVSIEDAVGDVLRALLRTLGERALVTHESHPDLPLISADTVQIRQAVFALLTNAVDAVASAHGSVEVLTGRETLDAAALAAMDYSAALGPGDYVFIDVKDDGPGIPDALIPRIFEPFFSTRDMGRGLGLAAVHGIVRGHNGAIRIWTGPAIGTRVRVWWPLS